MRLQNKHDLKNYLANKRIAVIQKAHHTIHMQVQLTNNRLIDKKILEFGTIKTTGIYDVTAKFEHGISAKFEIEVVGL